MNRLQAIEITAELKGLMPFLTDEQGRIVAEELSKRDDPALVRRVVHSYVTDHEQFTLATFCAILPPRIGESSADAAELTRQQQRERREHGRELERQHDANRAVCDRLGDDRVDEIAREIIPMQLAGEPDLIALYLSGKPHKRQSVRWMVADYARAHRLVPSMIATLV